MRPMPLHPATPRRSAFTMIELIIVIVVLGLLAGIGIVAYGQIVTSSQDRAGQLALTDVAREASALAAQNGETEWSEDDFSTALADTAAGPTLPGAGVSAAGKLTLVNAAADSTNSSSMSYGQVSLQTRAGGIAGLAMRTQSGDCVFVRATLPQQVTAWKTGDLGGNCLASVGLNTGPGGSYTHSDTVVAGATPLAPTGLTATATGSTVSLSWTPVTGATGGYLVYRSADGGATWAKLTGPQPGTAYTDGSAPAGAVSTYAVTATAANESPKSATATATPAPPAPVGVTAVATNTSIALTWQTTPGATTYRVYRDGGTSPSATGLTSPSWTDTGLPADGATHTYTVTAVDPAGEGPASAPTSSTVIPPAPAGVTAAPTTLPGGETGTMVTVSWAAAPGATGYAVKRGGVLAGTTTDGSTTSFTDGPLKPGTYSWTVTASNPAGTGAVSASASATVTGYSSTVSATSGLIGYWRLDQPAGSTTVGDSSGRNHTGTLPASGVTLNQPSLLSNDPNPSAVFSSSAPAGVNVGTSADFNVSQLTVEAWVKTPAVTGETWMNILSKEGMNGSSTTRDYNFYLASDDQKTVNVLHFSSAALGAANVAKFPALAPGSVHYVAMTITTGGMLTFYLDGSSVGSAQVSGGTANNSYPVLLGRDYYGNGFNGGLDEVALYNRALSATEIAAHYQKG